MTQSGHHPLVIELTTAKAFGPRRQGDRMRRREFALLANHSLQPSQQLFELVLEDAEIERGRQWSRYEHPIRHGTPINGCPCANIVQPACWDSISFVDGLFQHC